MAVMGTKSRSAHLCPLMVGVPIILDFNSFFHSLRNKSRQESIGNIFEVGRLLS